MEVFAKGLRIFTRNYRRQVSNFKLKPFKECSFKQGYELASSYARMPAGRTDKIIWTKSCTTNKPDLSTT